MLDQVEAMDPTNRGAQQWRIQLERLGGDPHEAARRSSMFLEDRRAETRERAKNKPPLEPEYLEDHVELLCDLERRAEARALLVPSIEQRIERASGLGASTKRTEALLSGVWTYDGCDDSDTARGLLRGSGIERWRPPSAILPRSEPAGVAVGTQARTGSSRPAKEKA